MAKKYIETDKLKQMVEHKMDMQDTYLPVHFFDIVGDMPAADVVEIKDVIGILAKYRYNLATSVWEFCEELCALCGVTDRESTYQKYSARTDEVE